MFGLQAEQIEITQKASGKTLTVDVVSLDSDNVTIKNASGKSFEVPLASLTGESVKAIQERLAKYTETKRRKRRPKRMKRLDNLSSGKIPHCGTKTRRMLPSGWV